MGKGRGAGERRTIAAVLSASVAGAGLAWGVVESQAGCQLQGSCDGDTVTIPSSSGSFPAGAGIYGDAGDVWQSSAIEGDWLWFPGQRTYIISPQLRDGGPLKGPYTFQAWISADPNPYTTSGSNFAPSAGNPTEFSGVLPDGGTNGFVVMNGTCSPYYLWVQATQEGALDAGTGALDATSPPPPSTDAQVALTPDAGDD